MTDPNEVPKIQPARAPPGDAAADEGTEVPPIAVTTPRGSAGPLAHDLDETIQLRLSQRHTRCVAPREFRFYFKTCTSTSQEIMNVQSPKSRVRRSVGCQASRYDSVCKSQTKPEAGAEGSVATAMGEAELENRRGV